jgi:anti-anti-sigma regulatory factor
MEITVSRVQARVPVTVLQPHGELDGSNYRELIARGQAAQKAGAQYILLDLSDVPYVSSAGLVALHTIANLLRGGQPSDTASGWEALHAMRRDLGSGAQQCLKLCGVQSDVQRVLTLAGLTDFYEVYPDQAAGLASF